MSKACVFCQLLFACTDEMWIWKGKLPRSCSPCRPHSTKSQSSIRKQAGLGFDTSQAIVYTFHSTIMSTRAKFCVQETSKWHVVPCYCFISQLISQAPVLLLREDEG
jgi:hypothetical protein